MKNMYLKLLVGLAIAIGIANANSTAVANTRLTISAASFGSNVRTIGVDSIQENAAISNTARNRMDIGESIIPIDIRDEDVIGIVAVDIQRISNISRIVAIRPEIVDTNIQGNDIEVAIPSIQ